MVWVALVGVALQVVGLWLAVVGVGETYREAVGGDLWRDVRSDFGAWFRRVILRKPVHVTVHLATAHSKIGALTGHAFLQARPPEPAADASFDERLNYLTQYVEALSEELVTTRAHAKTLIQEAEARASTRIDEVSARIDTTNDNVGSLEDALVGTNGAGLKRAAVGLAVTLVGVVFSVAGLSW